MNAFIFSLFVLKLISVFNHLVQFTPSLINFTDTPVNCVCVCVCVCVFQSSVIAVGISDIWPETVRKMRTVRTHIHTYIHTHTHTHTLCIVLNRTNTYLTHYPFHTEDSTRVEPGLVVCMKGLTCVDRLAFASQVERWVGPGSISI